MNIVNAHILDLQRKAETDINAFQRLISIQITQLSSQIQNMKMSDFIQEFGYILDGNTLQRDADSDADKQKTTRIVRHLDCFSKVKAAEDASAAIHVDLKRNDDGQYIPQLCCNDQMYSLTSETISEMDPSTLNNITSQIEIILQTLENAKNKLKTK